MFLFFWWYWSLNSGSHTCSTTQAMPQPQVCKVLLYVFEAHSRQLINVTFSIWSFSDSSASGVLAFSCEIYQCCGEHPRTFAHPTHLTFSIPAMQTQKLTDPDPFSRLHPSPTSFSPTNTHKMTKLDIQTCCQNPGSPKSRVKCT
jgi:hypothetical protein